VDRTVGYTLDNAWRQARERLVLLEALADPVSIPHLEALGVGAGWRCLEVGAGAGSIADWLCQRVGPAGSVLATDIDPRFLEARQQPNLEVRQHNILTDPLPEAAFDLIHARNLLLHLAEPQQALRRMVAALKPGGWLLAEEPDFATFVPDPAVGDAVAALFMRGWAAADQVASAAGGNTLYGRRLYGDLRAMGLRDVDATGSVPILHGGTLGGQFWRLTYTQYRERMVGTGLITEDEIEQFLALFDDPEFVWMPSTSIAAWGRRAAV
jgi:SAM-dependent methyltransferase